MQENVGGCITGKGCLDCRVVGKVCDNEGDVWTSGWMGECLDFRVDGRVYDREWVDLTSGWMGGCMTGNGLGGWEGV